MRKKAKEDQLAQQLANNILDNLASGIVAIDLEHKIRVLNRQAEKILKVQASQVLGKDVTSLQTNLVSLLLDTLDKGKSYHRQELYISPEKEIIGVSTSQFFDLQGRLLGACMVFNSLAEIKKKEKLQQQQGLNAYWSSMAASLAHRVKNSIMSAKVYTELLPERYTDGQFRSGLYSTLKRDMARLDEFSEDLLKFAAEQKMLMQPCYIERVLDQAVEVAIEDKDISEIEIKKRYGRNLKTIQGDYYQLQEAFANIITNALEAMPAKGSLKISLEYRKGAQLSDPAEEIPADLKGLLQEDAVVVKIKDTGLGISAENLPRLFDPFFTTKEGRPGLGLSKAHKIIEAHKGIIAVESRPNQGSIFWVCLPALAHNKIKHSSKEGEINA